MSVPLVFGWIFLVIGLVALVVLLIHVEAGKEFSIPFSAITIIILSICLGLGIQLLLVAAGI